MIIRNSALFEWIRPTGYNAEHIEALRRFLTGRGTFDFPVFKNGIFPAAGFDRRKFSFTGYQNAWVRDNVYIALAHYIVGDHKAAVKNAVSMAKFFERQRSRFQAVIEGTVDSGNPMKRPHIRFNGRTCRSLRERWGHAQNDALGYFVWFYSRLMMDGHIPINSANIGLLALFVSYFDAIQFWRDEDNGHWEEHKKIEASSIGVVTGGLRLFREVLRRARQDEVSQREFPKLAKDTDRLIARGKLALDHILPAESVQPGNVRRYDAALLFLIWPMELLSDKMADRVLRDVTTNLQGDYGIRRYLGDSYWAADYKKRLAGKNRHIAHSDSTVRDEFFAGAAEAQWCIFDPIVSIIYGQRFGKTGRRSDLERQVYHLNRSLGQLTDKHDPAGPFRCPELYCLANGRYRPNDHTPLLWTQANLMMALGAMSKSLS